MGFLLTWPYRGASICRKVLQITFRLQAKRKEKLEAFGLRLRGLAEKHGLKQAEIARRLGINSPGRVGNWFQGQNMPREHASALARLLGTTTDFLLEGRYESGGVEMRLEEPSTPYRRLRRCALPQATNRRQPSRQSNNARSTWPSTFAVGSLSHAGSGLLTLSFRDKFPLEKPERLKKELQ